MLLLSVVDILSGKIAHALCWMLVHSLWIGIALAVVTGIIMLSTKKQSAKLRYNLLTASLFLFSGAVITVFIMQLSASGNTINEQVAISAASTVINVNDNLQAFTIIDNNTSLTSSIINFLNNNTNVIVLCWLLILTFRGIRLASGLHKIKQMRTTQLTPVNEYWKERLTVLVDALKIRADIQLMQSGIAKIPMVAGHFKPMILFPIGLINSLPAAEVEAILLHELAHIRRKDYLVNMLQNLTEVIFFFNPAVLWVSALIKIERENCCDDIALAQTSSKRDYINALVSFQEYQLNAPQYATALTDSKKHLLERVKRMLYNNNKTLNAMEKTFLTVCFIVATSLTVFFTQAQTGKTKTTTITPAKTDTFISIADRYYNPADFEEGSNNSYSEKIKGVTHTLYIFKREGKLYEIYGDITSFKIDGKKIPQEEWGKYKELIAQLHKDYERSHVAADIEEVSGNEAAITENDEKKLQLQLKIIAEKGALATQQEKMQAEQDKLQNNRDKFAAEQDVIAAKKDRLTAEQDAITAQKDKLVAEQDAIVTEKDKLTAEMDSKNALLQLQKTEKNLSKEDKNKMEKLQLQIQQLKQLQLKKNLELNQKNQLQLKLKSEADQQKQLQLKLKAEKDAAPQKTETSSTYKREIERKEDNDKDITESKLSYSERRDVYDGPQKTDVYNKPYVKDYNKEAYKLTGIQSDGNSNAGDVDVKLLTNRVIADLIKARVIDNAANLSYEVSNERLIVNGKVQPEDLHQQLKTKYIKSPDWKLLYNFLAK